MYKITESEYDRYHLYSPIGRDDYDPELYMQVKEIEF